LVEPPPPQTRAIKGHRHDEVSIAEKLGAGVLRLAAEQGKPLLPSRYLKLWIRSRMVSE
jgi:hypothetical protein